MSPEVSRSTLDSPLCRSRVAGDDKPLGGHTGYKDLAARLTFWEGGSSHHVSKSLFKELAGVF